MTQVGRFSSSLYQKDLAIIDQSHSIDWQKLAGRRLVISGATGQIGAFLIDAIMRKNRTDGLGISICALGRSSEKAESRLPYFDDPLFSFEKYDLNSYGSLPQGPADLIFHLASTTHPRAYATQPISTITSNFLGLLDLLTYASQQEHPTCLVFASSVEVYGQNRGDVDDFPEDYCGYINCNTLRAGYPEAKRCCEALCQAFMKEKGVPVFLPRIPRTFGPTLLPSDSKAVSQFLKNGLLGQNIVLKSAGNQHYSFLYVADTVEAILSIVTRGKAGVAYNIADSSSNGTLKSVAHIIADNSGTKVIHEVPDSVEAAGYSNATHATMDSSRLKNLGWSAHNNLQEGIVKTLQILREDKHFCSAIQNP